MNNILEAIERERWVLKNSIFETITVKLFKKHNSALDRIVAAARQPRVMKRWGVDGVPTIQKGHTSVEVWISGEPEYDPTPGKTFLTQEDIERITSERSPDVGRYWLELEPTPVLPKKGA